MIFLPPCFLSGTFRDHVSSPGDVGGKERAQEDPCPLYGSEDGRNPGDLNQPLSTGQAGFLCPSGGEVSREQPRLADAISQQQAPSHSLVPGETHQQQWCPLEERLERLEAEVTDLRKQVPWRQGWVRVGFVYWEKERA